MSIANCTQALAIVGFRAIPISLAFWVALAIQAPRAEASSPAKTVSTREAREDAVRAIPYARLSRGARAKVSNVLSATTLYRRLPSQRVDCDPELFQFLIEHPDLVVNIWQVLGISEVTLDRVDTHRFEADDRAGTLGVLEFLHSSPTLHLMYSEGSYEGPLFGRPVKGRVLLLMRTSEASQADGPKYVRCRLDAFLQVENVGVGVLAKTFQPLIGAAADHNFHETAKFLAALNRAVEVNQAGMRRMAEKLDRVEVTDREQFAALTDQLAVKAMAAAVEKDKQPTAPIAQTARKPMSQQVRKPSAKPTAKSATKPTMKPVKTSATQSENSAVRRPTSRRTPR